MKKLLCLLFLLAAQPAFATTYWTSSGAVSTTLSACDGDADPGVYCTTAAIFAGMAAGDTVKYKAGTYDVKYTNPAFPSGTSTSNRTKLVCETALACVLQTTTEDGAFEFNGVTKSFVEINGFDMDGSQTSSVDYDACILVSGGSITGFLITNFACRALGQNVLDTGAGFRLGPAFVGNTISHGEFKNLNSADGQPGAHGIYMLGADNIMEHLHIHDVNGLGIQIFNQSATTALRNTVRYSRIYSTSKSCILSSSSGAQNTLIHDNIIHDCGSAGISSSATGDRVYHNAIHTASTTGLSVTASGAIARNNVSVSTTSCAFGSATESGNTCGGTAASLWIDPSNATKLSRNYSPVESSALINGGGTFSESVLGATATFSTTGRYVGANPDAGPLEASVRLSAVVEAGDTDAYLVSFSMPSQATRNGVGLQGCTTANWALREDAAGKTENACTIPATNTVQVGTSAAFSGGTTIDDAYTRGTLKDSVCIGDANSNCHDAWVLNYTATTGTNNVAGSPAVTWTMAGWRCLSYYADTTPASTDWLRAENASPTTLPCMMKAGGKGLVVLSLRASGANPDATTFEWMGNYDGGAYADLTNTAAATALGFLGTNPPNMNDLATFSCLLSVSTPCATGVVIAQQASQPSVDAAENDEFEVILAVKSDAATTVGKQLCIKAALAGLTEASVTQATPPCFQIANAASGF